MDVTQFLRRRRTRKNRPAPSASPKRRHRLGRLLGAAAIVGTGALGFSVYSNGPTASAATRSSAARPVSHEKVTIKNFAFHPANFTVKPGATITVTNKDTVTHTFTADDGVFNTGDIAPGKTKTVKAPKKPGKYGYRCEIHQFMTGTLTVK